MRHGRLDAWRLPNQVSRPRSEGPLGPLARRTARRTVRRIAGGRLAWVRCRSGRPRGSGSSCLGLGQISKEIAVDVHIIIHGCTGGCTTSPCLALQMFNTAEWNLDDLLRAHRLALHTSRFGHDLNAEVVLMLNAGASKVACHANK